MEQLPHIYWLGGGSAAGKSTIARRIASEHGLRVYSTDDLMADHARRSSADECPLLHQFMAMGLDERWVNRSPQVMFETFHWFQGEGFNLIVEDVLDMPREQAFVSPSSLRGSDQSYLTEALPRIDYNDKSKLFDVLLLIRSSSNSSTGSYSVKGFFDNDARCYLQITTFARFINFNALSTERMTAQKLSVRLTRLGFKKVEVAARQGENTISVRMYASPAKFFDSLS